MAIAGYKVRIRPTAGSYGAAVDVGNVLTYQFTGLTPATEYKAQRQAYDDSGNHSDWSAEATATTDALLFDGFTMTRTSIYEVELVNPLYAGACCQVDIGGTPTDIDFADVVAEAANDYEIITIYDQSGNGNDLSTLFGAPTLSINPYNGKPGFYCPSGAVLGDTGYTDWNGQAHWNIWTASKPVTNPNGFLMVNGNAGRYVYKAGGNSNRFTQFSPWFSTTSDFYTTARFAGEIDRLQYDGGAGTEALKARHYQNNLERSRDAGSGTHETTLTNSTGIYFNGDSAGANTLDRWYHAIYLIGQSVGSTFANAIHSHLDTKYFTLGRSQLIPIGDSLTFGIGTASPPTDANTYPAQLKVLLEAETGTTWETSIGSNFSESAAKTERVLQMAEGAGTAFDLIDVHFDHAILCLWVGTNDFAIDGDSVASVVTGNSNIITPAFARHADIYVANMLVRTDLGGGNAAFETKRLDFNTDIVAALSGVATLVDLAGRAELDDSTDGINFDADEVHLTGTGYSVVADEFFNTIQPNL